MPVTNELDLPYPDPLAEANVPADLAALANRLEAILVYFRFGTAGARPPVGSVPEGAHWFATDTQVESVKIGGVWVDVFVGIPIGMCTPYTGAGDPVGGSWLVADGRLILSATYPAYDLMIGESAPVGQKHMYNGGLNPGSLSFRIPDKRGRTSVGAGTATGANGATAKVRGTRGGEETHRLIEQEMPNTVPARLEMLGPDWGSGAGSSHAAFMGFSGVGPFDFYRGPNSPGNNMPPYEVDNWIVRVR